MMRIIVLVVVVVMIAILAGCAAVPVDCRLPAPPESLLSIPAPLPPVPADLPERR